MSAVGLSVLVFGIYLVLNGAGFTLIPNTLLGLLSVPATNEPWIRILGWVKEFIDRIVQKKEEP